ncbi:MAG: hypothetical protein ACFE0P_02055 [Oceanicaulis sp.]
MISIAIMMRRRPFVAALAALLAGSAVFALLIAVFEFAAVTFVNSGGAETLGESGEYLNFLYGVPVALLGAVLGVFLTVLGFIFAKQQNEIEILRFVEEKTLGATKTYILLRKIMERAMIQCSQLTQVSRRATKSREELEQSELNTDEKRRRLDEIAQQHRKDAEKQIARLAGVLSNPAEDEPGDPNLLEIVENLATDPYTALFLREQTEARKLTSPLRYLSEHWPLDDPSGLLRDDFLSISDNLALVSATPTYDDWEIAYTETPINATKLDILGAMLFSAIFQLKTPRETKAGRVTGFIYNVGAAYLLGLYDMLPRKENVEAAFSRIFSDRSEAASNFLSAAGPDRTRIASPDWLLGFEPLLDKPERMIITVIEGTANQFYDGVSHGPLPTIGDLDVRA